MNKLTTENQEQFRIWLVNEERSAGTIEKYMRDVRTFAGFLNGRTIVKEELTAWKGQLVEAGYAPVTINSMLTSVNTYLRFVGMPECRVKQLRLQRRVFRDQTRELSREEYDRLLSAARRQGKERLELLMETICATGIRVSEVQNITIETLRQGRAEISLKGKIRTILLPGKLRRKLQKYAQKQKIASGEIFLTRNGKPLTRKQIWAEMKALCQSAGVETSKVFPHNLRHLFARIFYKTSRDIAQLADVLGHSSIETTRIYLITTGAEHLRRMDLLGLVS
ncbi:MAG: tyrosine-type recombinase/integrase [Oscillospiraceae bacterium]|jgi:integrase/recombinase XerD|nr:tyrosine-type recombinase/integrase [Oscillospiraceae bacterium]